MISLRNANFQKPQAFDGASYIKETNRRKQIPQADRKFFDFLEKEGGAKADADRNPSPVFDGRRVIEENRRRAQMNPEDRRQLELVENAQRKFEDIDNNAGPGFNGSTYFKKQEFLNSLSAEDREMLDKVRSEDIQRPNGLYPFNKPSYIPQPFPGTKTTDVFQSSQAMPDQNLRQLAIRMGRF